MNEPGPEQPPPRTAFSAGFWKIMLGLCLLTLVACWLKMYPRGARPAATAPAPESAAAPAPAPEPDAPRFKPVRQLQPAALPSAAPLSASPSGPEPGDDTVVFHALALETASAASGTLVPPEPQASYRVPRVRAGDLQRALNAVLAETNNLARLKDQAVSLWHASLKDSQDYLALARATDQSAQEQRQAAQKKLLDLQALYVERKRQYQQEIAPLQLSLQDSLPVMDQKLALKRQAVARYQSDINELETAIHKLQQDAYTVNQGQLGAGSQMELAFRQTAQDRLQAMTNAATQLRKEVLSLNTLIMEFNTNLKRYGVREP